MTLRRITNHQGDKGEWCRWSWVTVTPDYPRAGCPDACADSSTETVRETSAEILAVR